MRQLFLFLTVVVSVSVSGQIRLKWKIRENEYIRYTTYMNEVGGSYSHLNYPHFHKALGDSSEKSAKEVESFFQKLDQLNDNMDYTTTLQNNGNGAIEITMSASQKDQSTKNKEQDAMFTAISAFNQGIVLRGSVYEDGGIHSFWLTSRQKNLLSLLFELPKKTIKVGDTWQLDIHLIGNDQNFVCDSSYYKNEAKLTKIETRNGDTIATLKYTIIEYVKGKFNGNPFNKTGTPEETSTKFTNDVIAKFSVNKGCWISYDGFLDLLSTNIAGTSKSRIRLALIESN